MAEARGNASISAGSWHWCCSGLVTYHWLLLLLLLHSRRPLRRVVFARLTRGSQDLGTADGERQDPLDSQEKVI